MPLFAAILRIPFSIIAPVIIVVCCHRRLFGPTPFDCVLMLIFGVLGYLFKKLDYPIAPLVLAMVLGDKAEDAFRQSMLMSQGSLGIFFGNALVTTLVLAGFALLLVPPTLRLIRHRPAPEMSE